MELMIVITVIAILGAIAYPSYTAYVLRGKLSEGRAFLLDSAAIQERYYSDCNRYGAATGAANNCAGGIIKMSATSESGLYTLTIGNLGANAQTFLLTAAPTFDDPDCGSLTLDQTGTKNKTGTKSIGDCWGR